MGHKIVSFLCSAIRFCLQLMELQMEEDVLTNIFLCLLPDLLLILVFWKEHQGFLVLEQLEIQTFIPCFLHSSSCVIAVFHYTLYACMCVF